MKKIKVGNRVELIEKGGKYKGVVRREVNGRYFVLCDEPCTYHTLEFQWSAEGVDTGCEIIDKD